MTVQDIIKELEGYAESENPVAPSKWLDCAQRLNILSSSEFDLLIQLQQRVARLKLQILNSQTKRNVAAVNLEVEASQEYAEMNRQQALIDRINEFIRLAKAYARVKSTEYGQQW